MFFSERTCIRDGIGRSVHQIHCVVLVQTAVVSGAVTVLLVPVTMLIVRDEVRREDRLQLQTGNRFEFQVRRCQQTVGLGAVRVHIRNGQRVEIQRNGIGEIVLELTVGIQYRFAFLVHHVNRHTTRERQRVVQRAGTGRTGHCRVLDRMREVHVQARTQPVIGLCVNVDFSGITFVVSCRSDTVLIQVTHREEMSRTVVTTAHVDSIVLCGGCLEHFLLPVSVHHNACAADHVSVGVQRIVVVIGVVRNGPLRLLVGPIRSLALCVVVVEQGLVVLFRVHDVIGLPQFGPRELGIQGDFCLTALTTFGRNQHDTISGT